MTALPLPRKAGDQLSVRLTDDHRYRLTALAVPGAFWSRDRRAYVVDNPSPRAAQAIITLFPEVLNDYPELIAVRDSAYGKARPYDFASELQIRMDVGPLGDKTLYEFQEIDGGYLAAIAKRDGGIHVGWDRGLGKTVITAAFVRKFDAQRTLVIARNDAKDDPWRKELSEVLPEHLILVLPNDKKKRGRMLDAIAEGRYPEPFVLIVHYQALPLIAGPKVVKHSDGSKTATKGGGDGWLRLGRWNLIAYDEAHRLASYNPRSAKNTQEGRALSKLRRQADVAVNLTGSGIMNRPDDLYGQLHFILPDNYKAKWRDWNNRYVDYVVVGNRKVPIGFRLDKLEEMRRELGVFMVYRTKAEVFEDLPPLIHQNIELDLHPEQRRVYNELRDQFWTVVEDEGLKAANPLAQMNLLRRIATYYPGVPSAKLDFAVSEMEAEPDVQWAVFTWYKEPGRALADRFGDEAVVVDGDVPIRHRAELLRRHRDGKARILVGSIATIGESLNLQYMSHAIRLDRDWNPQKNDQTTDRLYRNGQTEPVTFIDLWSKGTVDTLRVRPNLASKESLRRAVFGQ